MRLSYLYLAMTLLTPPARAEEPCTSALVESVAGKLSRSGSGAPLKEGDLLSAGGGFRTGPKTAADLRLCDGSVLRVGAETEMEFEDGTPEHWDLLLTRGAVRAAVRDADEGDGPRLRLRSPTASVGARAGEFLLEVQGEAPRTSTVYTLRGETLLGPDTGWPALGAAGADDTPEKFRAVKAGEFSSVASNAKAPTEPEGFERNKLTREKNRGAPATLFLRGVRTMGAKEVASSFARAAKKREKAAGNRP